jgi:hydrogenase-4 component B
LSCYLFWGNEKWGTLILTIGVITMFLGALLALFSVDLKRTLACSSVSQIGFILTGTGVYDLLKEHNALAAGGVLMHMVNHSMIKLLLFMAAGVVYMNLHELDLNQIRGFGRKKPLLKIQFLLGALGIGGIPLFNGYVSKTLIHESIVEYTEMLAEAGHSVLLMKGAEWIFLLSGGLTAAYMTKLFVAVFVEKNADPSVQAKYDALNRKYMNAFSAAALLIPAALLPLMGSTPSGTMARIAALGQEFMHLEEKMHAIHWFSLTNLKGAGISLLIGAAVYRHLREHFTDLL